jgi:predicted PurR-regulated permease PerM
MDDAVGHERPSAVKPHGEPGAPPLPPSRPPGSRLRAPTLRVALLLATSAIVGALLYLGREAVSPFVVGLLLVYLLNPLVERVARRGVPRWVAVLIVYVVTILVLVQALSFLIRPLLEQIRTFASDLPAILAQAQEMYRGLDLPPALREAIDGWIASAGQAGGEGGGVDPTVLLPVVNLTAGFISGIFGYIIIPVWAFYLLKDRPHLARSFDRTLPQGWRRDVWEIVRIVDRVFGQWIRGQVFLGVTVGIATFVGLMILNFAVDPVFGRFALLLAVSAGILELLPIIGPIIAAIPAVLLALTAGPEAAIAALLLYLLVQQIENNLLVPKIQGDAVELHPSAVMFSLVVGGAIAGLLGAILALPVTAAGRDVYRYLFHRLSDEPADHAATAVREPDRAREELHRDRAQSPTGVATELQDGPATPADPAGVRAP